MTPETITAFLAEHNIQKVKYAFADIDGVLRGKVISARKLLDGLTDGFGFCDVVWGWDMTDTPYDNGSTTGWQSGYPDAPVRAFELPRAHPPLGVLRQRAPLSVDGPPSRDRHVAQILPEHERVPAVVPRVVGAGRRAQQRRPALDPKLHPRAQTHAPREEPPPFQHDAPPPRRTRRLDRRLDRPRVERDPVPLRPVGAHVESGEGRRRDHASTLAHAPPTYRRARPDWMSLCRAVSPGAAMCSAGSNAAPIAFDPSGTHTSHRVSE